MILIISASTDRHAERVSQRLGAMGVRHVWLDVGSAASVSSVSFRISDEVRGSASVECGSRVLSLSDVTCAWYRRPSDLAQRTQHVHPELRAYSAGEFGALFNSLWRSNIEKWLPAEPGVIERAEDKALQLTMARETGFDIPDTLVTNDRRAVVDFYQRYGGRVLKKPLRHGTLSAAGSVLDIYATPVTLVDLLSQDDIPCAPFILQQVIPKDFEVRVTVVDDALIAIRLDSQVTYRTQRDWRNYDFAHTPLAVHQLPKEIEERCLSLTRLLGLRFGAIDLIVSPGNRYLFLEINPNGQYLWLEHLTGVDITGAVCGALQRD